MYECKEFVMQTFLHDEFFACLLNEKVPSGSHLELEVLPS